MKVLLMTEVFPPRNGGSGRWLWEIYRRLEKPEPIILAGAQARDQDFDRTHSLCVERAAMSFPSWGVVSPSGLACYRQLAQRAERLIDFHRPTQLHCGKILPEGFVAWWLKRRLGMPYLVYVHGEELNIASGSRELRWMTRRVLTSADRVIANSENTAGLLCKTWSVSENQLRILHPGVDIDRFCPAERDAAVRQRLGWGERPVILTVGRLQKRKGQDQLIRAMPKLIQSQPNLLYSIIGDGPERKTLGRLVADLGVADSVEFREEVTDDEMVRCYQQCDIFALPNRTVDGDFEGFGMVLLEAQACGKPVITGASGGTGEAICEDRTGRRVDCQRLERLTESLMALLADPETRASMGQRGREWTTLNFGWEALTIQAAHFICGINARPSLLADEPAPLRRLRGIE
ncbi:glycosyltransferase family 4 protein [Candidatus Laterigemmans baculatus]|uniref:glycosyltransferase family 4 protein n=1 Tax=Candidatus Laterigemmans baculatus TaxID=2770505 RepID=UPI0013DA9F98|nr:glycosyltransferase family 4 protein [Candidatus Laterigemmans baculatus]